MTATDNNLLVNRECNVRAVLVSEISNLRDHNPPASQTDGRTTCDRKTALCTIIVHRVVTKPKENAKYVTGVGKVVLHAGCRPIIEGE